MAESFLSIEQCTPLLMDGQVHIYSLRLEEPDEGWPLLNEAERERASRFKLKRIRDQFVSARSNLRILLSRYLDMDPVHVPIWYADGGKPHLPSEFPLHFNVSHTDGLAVFAFGRGRVGVDVERFRAVPDAAGLVTRFFSPRECELFQKHCPDDHLNAFFRAWTRKEAILKAVGRGVQALDCCEVTFGKDDPPQLIHLDGDTDAANHWSIFAWEPAPGYIAAGAREVQVLS
jgi:4'-phosphopantetheinyl transferase